MSLAKWETFKRMLLALFAIVLLTVAASGLAAWLFHSEVAAVLAAVCCVPASLLGAAVAGWRHDRSVKTLRETAPEFCFEVHALLYAIM